MAATTVPLNPPLDQSTRRHILAGFAAAGVLGSASALAGPEVDPHHRWIVEAREQHARWLAAIDVDPTTEQEARAAYWERWRLITETEPRTFSGLALQLRVVFWDADATANLSEREEEVVERVATTLDRLASGRVAS